MGFKDCRLSVGRTNTTITKWKLRCSHFSHPIINRLFVYR